MTNIDYLHHLTTQAITAIHHTKVSKANLENNWVSSISEAYLWNNHDMPKEEFESICFGIEPKLIDRAWYIISSNKDNVCICGSGEKVICVECETQYENRVIAQETNLEVDGDETTGTPVYGSSYLLRGVLTLDTPVNTTTTLDIDYLTECRDKMRKLTDLERFVCVRKGQGAVNRIIAKEAGISASTVHKILWKPHVRELLDYAKECAKEA